MSLRVCGAPVDFVARAIVSLSTMAIGSKATYHLVNPNDLSWNDFCDWFAAQGYRTRKMPYEEWRNIVLSSLRTKRDNALAGLSPFLSERAVEHTKLPPFDCSNAVSQLRTLGLSCPPMDGCLLSTCLSYYRSVGYLPSPGG